MTTNDLQSKDHRGLLDIIDQLRSQGFSRYVDLPEIIVCGDQSAGKSSVLEAISGMSFPTKDNVCTRFATELILRRHPTESVKISITPGSDRYQQEKDLLQRWQPQENIKDVGLESVIEEAKSIMGLTTSRLFSNDILRVELSGPTQPHLTMVDLPGLFRAGNKEQSADNVEMVKQMVTRYMKRDRSIILAVVSAKNEYVLQDVTEFASKADPEGLRTLGLITKPDKLDEGSDSEASWVRLASNEDVELTLGWHVLKNRSYEQREFTSAQRDEDEEQFFSRGAWARMDPELCGVKSLKSRLSSVLREQILKQLPSLVADVERGIEGCNSRLARLGDARESPEQQLRYLTRISDEFTNLMTAAIKGNYSNTFFRDVAGLDGYEKRLRAVVQNRLEAFQTEMLVDGQSLFIVDNDDEQTYGDRSISRYAYVEKVKDQMSYRRGCELPGLFNPDIISDLFAKQCQPWREIVASMTRDILDSVYRTTKHIVKHMAADDVADKLLVLLNTRIEEYEQNLESKVEELLLAHYEQHSITYNHQLTENVQKAQQARRKRAMEKKLAETFGIQTGHDFKIHTTTVRIMDLYFDEFELDMRRYGSSLAVDYMEAYYKVAFDRFVDDVSALAIEECLIRKLPNLLKPSRVFELDQDEIQRLVGESEETASVRTKLSEKRTLLQKGLQDLKGFQTHRDRSVSSVPQTPKPSVVNGYTARWDNRAAEPQIRTLEPRDQASDPENNSSDLENNVPDAEVHGLDWEEDGLRPLSLVQQFADAESMLNAGLKKKKATKLDKKRAQAAIIARYEEPEPVKVDEGSF